MDMSKHGKKEFPSQTENRRQWILDTVRANQGDVMEILDCFFLGEPELAKAQLQGMHKMDRDAILQPGGILTDKQIQELT